MHDPKRKRSGFRTVRKQAKPAERGWDAVAGWYDKLVGESGHDYHRHLILPCAMRMLDIRRGERAADVCCGQGVLVPLLLEAGAAHVTGVDASPKLVRAARERFAGERRAGFLTADASAPGDWADGSFDAAACVMAVHDVADLDGLAANLARCLKPGGRLVMVSMHPCFRVPKLSHWGWDNGQSIQFRRMDAYATPQAIEITTHPGKGDGVATDFHHRPLAMLISALGGAGLGITACEELCSHRRSQAGGPFSRAEHKAAGEFPLFLALRAVKSP